MVHTPSGCCWKMDVILKKFSKSFHCLKIFLCFDCTFKLRACSVITLCQPHCHRGHTSVAVTLRPKQKWRPFSQIIKTPNWLTLTPLAYMLPYHLNRYCFVACYTKSHRLSFCCWHFQTHSLHENCEIVIVNWHWGQSKMVTVSRWNFQIHVCLCVNCCSLIINSQ